MKHRSGWRRDRQTDRRGVEVIRSSCHEFVDRILKQRDDVSKN
jgi:hypothetical protein